MTRSLALAMTIAAMLAASALGATNAFPARIDLPDGFQPEGIAIAGQQFYVGSIPTGAPSTPAAFVRDWAHRSSHPKRVARRSG